MKSKPIDAWAGKVLPSLFAKLSSVMLAELHGRQISTGYVTVDIENRTVIYVRHDDQLEMTLRWVEKRTDSRII